MAKREIASTVDAGADTAADAVARIYEVGYHIVSTVKDDDLESVVQGIRAVIERAGGSFIAEGAPSLVKLAYPMEHREGGKRAEHDRAFFGWIKFEASAAAAHALDAALKGSADILRFIIFRTVREDIRSQIKAPILREVRRTDTIKSAPHRMEESAEPISEAQIDRAIEELTTEVSAA